MVKIKTIICTLLLMAVSAAADAQSAKQILDRATDMVKSAKGISAAFTVRSDQMSDGGTLDMSGDRFLLRTDAAVTWFNGKTQWTYIVDSQEVNVSEPDEEELRNINPYYLLSLYKKNYRASMQSAAPGCYKILLTSASRRNDIESVLLTLGKNDFVLKEMSVKRGAERADIKITSFKRGVSFPNGYFVFDRAKYPNAEIIDLR